MTDDELLAMNRAAQKRILAQVIADTYHGCSCGPEFVFGDETGGSVFVDCAEAVLSKLDELAE